MHISPHLMRHVHFIGIGGIGMSGLAEILHNLGYSISGSDSAENNNVLRLRRLGVQVYLGHAKENIERAHVAVVSTAIPKDNIEVVSARAKGVAVISRGEMLAELMRLKLSVAVAGTHGKTTTTSMMANLFEQAGLSPTIINGGILNAYNTNVRLGDGSWVVAEADESDGSFMKLFPTFAVVTNMDADHLDFYEDLESIEKAFLTFLDHVPFYGAAIACWDHTHVRERLLPKLSHKRVITYGLEAGAHIRATNIKPVYRAYHLQTPPQSTDALNLEEDTPNLNACAQNPQKFDVLGTAFDVDITPPSVHSTLHRTLIMPRRLKGVFIPMLGEHNVQNALAVLAMHQELGLGDAVALEALSTFEGVKRRFTPVGEAHGVSIIDDYAHHPVEVEKTLQAAMTLQRMRAPLNDAQSKRIIAVIQPHRYSRLCAFLNEFADALQPADHVIVAPVHSAGEAEIEGVSAAALVERIQSQGTSASLLNSFDNLADAVYNVAHAGDVVLCMGAGSITLWANRLAKDLEDLALQNENCFKNLSITHEKESAVLASHLAHG